MVGSKTTATWTGGAPRAAAPPPAASLGLTWALPRRRSGGLSFHEFQRVMMKSDTMLDFQNKFCVPVES